MDKLSKTFTLVLLLAFSSNVYAKKIKNPTFSKVRKSLWYMGINEASLEETEKLIEHEAQKHKGALELPEELKRPLSKL